MSRPRWPIYKHFETWMIEALQKHVDEGLSLSSFIGKYRIVQKDWYQWLNTVPELNAIRQRYITGRLSRQTMMSRAARLNLYVEAPLSETK